MPTKKRRKKQRTPKAPHRPPKISEDVIATIVKAARRGLHEEAMAALAGVSRSTMREWLRRGRRELERVESGPPQCRVRTSEALYADLSARVERALTDWQAEQVAAIHEVGQGYVAVTTVTRTLTRGDGAVETTTTETRKPVRAWQAALELLRRRFPEMWDRGQVPPIPEDEQIDPPDWQGPDPEPGP